MTVLATRFTIEESGDADEADALVEVEAGGELGYVDLHIDPRTDDVVTVSITTEQAWALFRELSRAIVTSERDD